MNKTRGPAIIHVLKQRASTVRQIAEELNFAYYEESVPDKDDIVRFTFNLSEADTQKLVRSLPIEVYAYRAIVGKIQGD